MKVTHDFHIHTHLSLCANSTATVEHYMKTAKELGLKKIGFSDHFWDSPIDGSLIPGWDFYASKVEEHQNFEHLLRIKPELEKYKDPDVQVYFGCETEYDPIHHGVAITEETAEKFDFIIVPQSHTHITMPKNLYQPYQKHLDYMINAYDEILDSPVSRYITAVVHPFEAVCCPYDNTILIDMLSEDVMKRLFTKSAEKEIAFEINVSQMMEKTQDEIASCAQIRMFKIVKECGCKFIFGSDSHDNVTHQKYANAQFTADLLGLTENDIAVIAR